jgi:hypothetical protein
MAAITFRLLDAWILGSDTNRNKDACLFSPRAYHWADLLLEETMWLSMCYITSDVDFRTSTGEIFKKRDEKSTFCLLM